jgi:hypothetical protein
LFRSKDPIPGYVSQAANKVNQDPVFADVSKDDFHVLENSPAVNAGVAAGTINTDFDGVTRPNPPATAPTIGCYEFKP